jgi:hypothetical protein
VPDGARQAHQGTCDRVKVRAVRQRETKGFPRSSQHETKLCADRPDFNQFFAENAKDEQDWKFRAHRELHSTAGEILAGSTWLVLRHAFEYWRRPMAIGKPPGSGRSTAPAKLSMAIPHPFAKLGRGRLPTVDKGAADRIFWFGRSIANTRCVMRFRYYGATSDCRSASLAVPKASRSSCRALASSPSGLVSTLKRVGRGLSRVKWPGPHPCRSRMTAYPARCLTGAAPQC